MGTATSPSTGRASTRSGRQRTSTCPRFCEKLFLLLIILTNKTSVQFLGTRARVTLTSVGMMGKVSQEYCHISHLTSINAYCDRKIGNCCHTTMLFNQTNP